MVPRCVESFDSLPGTLGLEKIAWHELKAHGIGSAWAREDIGYKVRRREQSASKRWIWHVVLMGEAPRVDPQDREGSQMQQKVECWVSTRVARRQ
jgi:hypothetical protein